jgi:type VI protein secretion system component VasK
MPQYRSPSGQIGRVPLRDLGTHGGPSTYEPRSLAIGLWSTGLASVAMLGIWAWALADWRRDGTSPTPAQVIGASREEQRAGKRARLATTKRLLHRARREP